MNEWVVKQALQLFIDHTRLHRKEKHLARKAENFGHKLVDSECHPRIRIRLRVPCMIVLINSFKSVVDY